MRQVVHSGAVHCECPIAVAVPVGDTVRDTDQRHLANHQGIAVVAADKVDTAVDFSRNPDVSLAEQVVPVGSNPVAEQAAEVLGSLDPVL